MNDLRKAAEMALEALMQKGEHHPKVYQAAEALRQALAQHVDAVNMSQERVDETAKGEHEPVCFLRETSWSYEIAPWDDPNGIPVYTAPPISDYHEGWEEGFKAATREQEPVAWLSTDCIGERYLWFSKPIGKDPAQPLYTAPPKREWVGLTDEEVDECYYWKDRLWTTDELVRHVEAKLKEKNGG